MKADRRAATLALVAALALGACQAEKKADGQATAGGEVLPGSVSDAMLPIDTVRSQSPLAPRTEAAGKRANGPDAAAPSEAADSEAAPAAGEPAAKEAEAPPPPG